MSDTNVGVVRSTLRDEDQRDLSWFLIEGQVVFDRSPMGAMLDRAEQFTFGSMICPSCEGSGFPGDVDTAIGEAIERAKKWEASSDKRLDVALREWRKEHGKEAPPWYDDGTCKVCTGSGWIPRARKFPRAGALTARPKQVAGSQAVEPSHDALERFGHVSRELRRISGEHQATLDGFFGLAGHRWADDPKRGRIWGVMALTKAGEKLIKRSRSKSDLKMSGDQRLHVQAELELIQPDKTKMRSALLALAHTQAVAMLRAAEDAYARRTPVDVWERVQARLKGMAA